MTHSHIIRYIAAAALIMMLGGLAGWYMFVKRQIVTVGVQDTARGFGTTAIFGSTVGSSYQNQQGFSTSSPIQTGAKGTPAPRLWHISATPVAGLGFAASSTQLYFAERATGNVLRADPSVQGIERLTNTLMPKIYEALFIADGSVLLRSVSDSGVITTFAGTMGTTSSGAPAALAGNYLPQGILSVAVRSTAPQIFAFIDAPQGTMGVTTDWKGQKQKGVLTSALKGWRTAYLSDGKMYITQNASDDVSGYAFRLDGSTLTPIVRDVDGLTFLPHANSGALLYGSSERGSIALYAQVSASSSPVRLPIRTIADKCVWAPGKDLIAYCAVPQTLPSSNYLRDWYRGALHTSDVWWKVDASAGKAEQFFAPDSTAAFDVVNPTLDPSGAYIAFMDATDQSLWMLKI